MGDQVGAGRDPGWPPGCSTCWAWDLPVVALLLPCQCHAMRHTRLVAHATVTFLLRCEMAVVRARGRHSGSGGRDWPVKSDTNVKSPPPPQHPPTQTYLAHARPAVTSRSKK